MRPPVLPAGVYGARVVETTIGSDYPPLAQLTSLGTVTAVTFLVT